MAYRVDVAKSAEIQLEGRSPHVYRVFFTVDESAKVVRVVHVRRGARQKPAPVELEGE